MNNSTKWCNLYSSASKFNINVYPSRYQQLVQQSVVVFAASHVVLLFNQPLPVVVAWYLLVMVSLVLYLGIKSQVIAEQHPQFLWRQSPSDAFSLQQNGLLHFSEISPHLVVIGQQSLQVHCSSRKGWWGCRLNLVAVEQHSVSEAAASLSLAQEKPQRLNSKAVYSFFIYKDSVSAEDYCRISRVLYAVKSVVKGAVKEQ